MLATVMFEELWPSVWRRAAGRTGLLPRINLNLPANLRGLAFKVPFVSGRSLYLGGEPWMVDLLAVRCTSACMCR